MFVPWFVRVHYYVTCDDVTLRVARRRVEKDRMEIVVPHSQNDIDLFEQDGPNSNQHGLPPSFNPRRTYGHSCCTGPSSRSKYHG